MARLVGLQQKGISEEDVASLVDQAITDTVAQAAAAAVTGEIANRDLVTKAEADDLYATSEALGRVDPGIPGVNSQQIRWSRGVPAYVKSKEVYLNDRDSIDNTGGSDTSGAITTYLSEYHAGGVTRVYLDSGSTYRVDSTVDVPAYVVIEGPNAGYHGHPSSHAKFVAGEDGMTMMRLAGFGASVHGVQFNMGLRPNVVAIRPNSHHQVVQRCYFGAAHATSTSVKGGGILYFTMKENQFSGGYYGRAVDLMDSYADNPSVVYYGVNVGWFERNIFAGPQGVIRAEGIFTIRDNDFEGGAGSINPAIEVSTAGGNSYARIEGNYFEMEGASQCILFAGGVTAAIEGNDLWGVQSSGGSFGVKVTGYVYSCDISRNSFNRLETAIDLSSGATNTSSPSLHVGANNFANCTTKVAGGPMGRIPGSADTVGGRATGTLERGDGRITHLGAVIGGAVYWQDTHGLTLDLRQGNIFHLSMSTGGTLTHVNAGFGQRFSLFIQIGTVTLNTATWNLASGEDETPAAGTIKDFIVDYFGTVREVNP